MIAPRPLSERELAEAWRQHRREVQPLIESAARFVACFAPDSPRVVMVGLGGPVRTEPVKYPPEVEEYIQRTREMIELNARRHGLIE